MAFQPAGKAPACPGPDPHPHPPRSFTLPAGAIDTHAHVIGAPPSYPFVANRSYTPPPATPEAYLAMLDAVGIARGVLIQVSVHGTDNRLMVETLAASRNRLRGIAVVPLGLPDATYRALQEAGVTGLRLNVLFGGGIGLSELERYGALCAELGWHVQLLLDARDFAGLRPRIAALPVPVIVDHMGHMPVECGIAHQGFQALAGFVRDGGWVKLSGAYRIGHDASRYRDTLPFARTLIEAAPDRCVWGSDWPHVAHHGWMMNVGDLLDLLAEWAPEEDVRNRILVDNPTRLYGFPSTTEL